MLIISTSNLTWTEIFHLTTRKYHGYEKKNVADLFFYLKYIDCYPKLV